MFNNKRKFLAALGVAGVVAAGGSAFTAGNTFDSSATVAKTGYGSTTVTGATVTSLVYTLNGAGDNVDSITLKLSGDTSAQTPSIGFNGGTTIACQAGSYAAGPPALTTYVCNNGGSAYSRSTSGLNSTAVVIN